MKRLLSAIAIVLMVCSVSFADSKVSALTAKTTLSAADLMYWSSGGADYKMTWASLEAAIKAYTDTLYQPIGGSTVPTLVTVADTTDSTAYVGLFESAAGNLAPKTDTGLTYNATTGMLTATGLTGPLTGTASGNVANSLYDAYTMLYADTDNTPAALTIAASRIVGRKSTGGIAALTGAEALSLIGGQASLTYPVTGVASPTAGYLTKWGASGNTIADGLKFGTMTDTKYCTYTAANGLICTSDGGGGTGDITGVGNCLSGQCDGPTFSGTVGAAGFSAAKATGVAGQAYRYEANSTDLDYVGEIGPASMTANTSYLLRDVSAGPTSANMVKIFGTSASGAGTPADPYIHAGVWADLDNYALLSSSPSFTGTVSANSFLSTKSSGVAGQSYRYEANSTDLDYVGEIGPAAMTGNTSYLLRDVAAIPTTNQVKIISTRSGAGTPADPYIFVQDWSDIIGNPMDAADQIIYSGTSGTPTKLDVTEQTVVGRITSGHVAALAIKGAGKVTFDAHPVTTLTPSTNTTPLTIDASVTDSLELAPTGTQTQTIAFSGNPSAGYARYVLIHITTAASGATTIDWPTPSSIFGWIGTAGIDNVALTASKEYQYACEVGPTKTRCMVNAEAY